MPFFRLWASANSLQFVPILKRSGPCVPKIEQRNLMNHETQWTSTLLRHKPLVLPYSAHIYQGSSVLLPSVAAIFFPGPKVALPFHRYIYVRGLILSSERERFVPASLPSAALQLWGTHIFIAKLILPIRARRTGFESKRAYCACNPEAYASPKTDTRVWP